jgi:predicted  nucleic acid-binding Zn-ribbon protein
MSKSARIWVAVGVLAAFVGGFSVSAMQIAAERPDLPEELQHTGSALESLTKSLKIRPLREQYENITPGAVMYVDEEQESIYAPRDKAFADPGKLDILTGGVRGDGRYWDRFNWSLSSAAVLSFMGTPDLATTLKAEGVTSILTEIKGLKKTGATLESLNGASLIQKYRVKMREEGIWVVQDVYRPDEVIIRFLDSQQSELRIDVDAIEAEFQAQAKVSRGKGAELVLRGLVLGFRPWLVKLVEDPDERAQYMTALNQSGVAASANASWVVAQPGAGQFELASSVVKQTHQKIEVRKERQQRVEVQAEKAAVETSLRTSEAELKETSKTLAAARMTVGKLREQIVANSGGGAEQFAVLTKELRAKETILATVRGELRTAQTTIKGLQGGDPTGELKRLREALAQRDKDLDQTKADLRANEGGLATVRGELRTAKATIERLQGLDQSAELSRLRESLAQLQKDLGQTRADLRAKETSLATVTGQLRSAQTEITGLNRKIQAQDRALREARRASEETARELRLYRQVYGKPPVRVGKVRIVTSPEAIELTTSKRLSATQVVIVSSRGRPTAVLQIQRSTDRKSATAKLVAPARGSEIWMPGG